MVHSRSTWNADGEDSGRWCMKGPCSWSLLETGCTIIMLSHQSYLLLPFSLLPQPQLRDSLTTPTFFLHKWFHQQHSLGVCSLIVLSFAPLAVRRERVRVRVRIRLRLLSKWPPQLLHHLPAQIPFPGGIKGQCPHEPRLAGPLRLGRWLQPFKLLFCVNHRAFVRVPVPPTVEKALFLSFPFSHPPFSFVRFQVLQLNNCKFF